MRTVVNVVRLLGSVIRYSAASRRWSLGVVVVLGIVLAAVVVLTKVVAPLAVYPFV